MTRTQHTFLLVFLFCSCIGCDQVSKDMARAHLRVDAPIALVSDTLHLFYAENPGVAFSLGHRLPADTRFWLFTIGGALALVGMFFVLLNRRGYAGRAGLALALLMGGGMSNLLDRFFNSGQVVDFVMVRGLPGVHTIIFNLADVLILTGLGLYLVNVWAETRREAAALDAAALQPAAAPAEPQ